MLLTTGVLVADKPEPPFSMLPGGDPIGGLL
jgi:hypothetical protein